MHRTPSFRSLWLLLGAALLAAAPAGAQRAPARDAEALAALRAEAERARQELDAAREQLHRYVQALGARPDIRRAELDSLNALTSRVTSARSRATRAEARMRLRSQAASRPATVRGSGQPAGWFGVTVQTLSTEQLSGGTRLVSAELPRINAVEPGSPAFKAGLRAGDRLVTIRGLDVRRGVDLAELLRPGAVLPVRYERDGELRDVAVRIEARPLTYESRVAVSIIESPREGAPAAVTVPGPRGARTMVRVGGRAGPVPGEPGAGVFVFSTHGTGVVAGAEVTQLNDNLREALGARHGLYVLRVVPGMPADRSGIRQGDVLVRAGTLQLDAPVDLVRAVRERVEADARMLRVELLRERKVRAVELKW